jgi:hypothetical protein
VKYSPEKALNFLTSIPLEMITNQKTSYLSKIHVLLKLKLKPKLAA